MILGISAHHDDLAIGAGGYLSSSAQTTEIAVVVLINHYLVGDTATRLTALREMAEAWHWRLFIWDSGDCNIAVSIDSAVRLGKLIKELNPEKLIVPTPGRHMDHASTYLLVRHAMRLTDQVQPLYTCDAYKGLLPSTEPLYYHDISAVIYEKLRMVSTLSLGQHGQDVVEYVRALSIVRGLEANTAHAEAFAAIPLGGNLQ